MLNSCGSSTEILSSFDPLNVRSHSSGFRRPGSASGRERSHREAWRFAVTQTVSRWRGSAGCGKPVAGVATRTPGAHPRCRPRPALAAPHHRRTQMPRRGERCPDPVPLATGTGLRGGDRSRHRGRLRSGPGPPAGSGTTSPGSTSSTSMRRCSTRPTTSARCGTPADTATRTSSCSRATSSSTATS